MADESNPWAAGNGYVPEHEVVDASKDRGKTTEQDPTEAKVEPVPGNRYLPDGH